MPDPMTTPGRKAAIEAAAVVLFGEFEVGALKSYKPDKPAYSKSELRQATCKMVNAYERVLAEQPRETGTSERDVELDTITPEQQADARRAAAQARELDDLHDRGYTGSPEQPRGEEERLSDTDRRYLAYALDAYEERCQASGCLGDVTPWIDQMRARLGVHSAR